MDDSILIYVVGTAGSGKSTFCNGFLQWFNSRGYRMSVVNLDPGVMDLPYDPDFDIRSEINTYDIMEEYNLGPNGAQIAAADLIATSISDLRDFILDLPGDYILIDTPGQIELFAFRSTSHRIVEELNPKRSALVFTMDPFTCQRPRDYISQLFLAVSVQMRFTIPTINVLTKTDIIEPEVFERIMKWSEDSDTLYEDLNKEKADTGILLNYEVFKIMDEMEMFRRVIPVASPEAHGFDSVYSIIQDIFMGGEDLEPIAGVSQENKEE